MAQVRSFDGRRVHFEGTDEDARTFVQNNYPRVHAEPGANYGDEGPDPDVYVTTETSGEKVTYVGGKWSDADRSSLVEPIRPLPGNTDDTGEEE